MSKIDHLFEKDVLVVFWSTPLHDEAQSTELSVQQVQNRLFTKDFDICGEVKDGDERGIFGYRKDAWEPPIDDEIEYYTKKRLVIRWFNRGEGDKIDPIGALEEMTLDSLRKTMIADDPLHSFRVILDDYPYVIMLTKENVRLPGRSLPEMWGFSLTTDPDNKEWEVFLLDERRFTIGTDFDVKKDDMKEILVRIDEQIFNLGKKVKITFYNKHLYEHKPFYRTILLFTMMFLFKKELHNKIKKARELILASKKAFSIDINEAALMRNPRALKR
nr:hypothetical protein [Candidatus Sigynarchaeota archaeon]